MLEQNEPDPQEMADLLMEARVILQDAYRHDDMARLRDRGGEWLDAAADILRVSRRIKPPLGCRPKFVVEQLRATEIAESIIRFAQAGHKVRAEVLEELADLVGEPEPDPVLAAETLTRGDTATAAPTSRDEADAKPPEPKWAGSPDQMHFNKKLLTLAQDAERVAADAARAFLRDKGFEGRIGISVQSSIE